MGGSRCGADGEGGEERSEGEGGVRCEGNVTERIGRWKTKRRNHGKGWGEEEGRKEERGVHEWGGWDGFSASPAQPLR